MQKLCNVHVEKLEGHKTVGKTPRHQKWSRIFSYTLALALAILILGASTFYIYKISPLYEKGDIDKCGVPSIEQIAHVLNYCPDAEGLKCTGATSPPPCEGQEIDENGKCKNYKWRFCNASWRSIQECPPITREEVNVITDSFGEDWCNMVMCVQGKWRTACVHIHGI